ncbi:MAG: purine/pyrimidine permease [Desulfocapsa sp.]|nr:purine/pyrimidine permease [Desulfocapsa sp.]
MSFKTMLDSVFPPFVESKVEKPRGMLFTASERPGIPTIIIVGAQHTLIILALIVYPVIVGKEIGLSDAEMRGFISLQILVLGIVTIIQNYPSRFGSGQLIIHNPSIISMASFIAVANTFGIGAAAGGILLSSLVVIFLARLLPKFQSLFPAEVTGVLLLLLGLSLVEGGVTRFTGFANGLMDFASIPVAATTLGVIVMMAIWTPGKIRVFSVAAGIVAGTIVAILMGKFGMAEVQKVMVEPIVALPFGAFKIPTPQLIIAAAIPQLIIEIISAVDSVGSAVAIDKTTNAKWTKPDMPMVGRTVTCHGIGLFLNGITGTLPGGTSSANLGLVAVTGVAARIVGITAGAILIVLAFLPQVSSFMTLIPLPVVGALIIYTAGYMMVVGMELILSKLMNSRRQFMIGLSLTVGMSLLSMPELASGVEDSMRPILGSALTMGVLTAVLLNQIFKIGVSQTAETTLEGYNASLTATKFLEEKGADWGARRDVINKAGIAIGEALEALHAEKLFKGGPIELRAKFDEMKLVISLFYEGLAFPLEDSQGGPDLNAFLDSDDDAFMDVAIAQMSGAMIRNLADDVSSSSKGSMAELKLQFSN